MKDKFHKLVYVAFNYKTLLDKKFEDALTRQINTTWDSYKIKICLFTHC